MPKKPKIAVIGLKGLPAYGGAAAVGENIINNLKNKAEFTVYSISSHTNLKSGFYEGFYQKVFKRIKLKKLNSFLYYIRSAIHAVFCSNYDLIHLQHRDASYILPILRLRYKVIVTTHGLELTSKWKKYKWLFEIGDKIFLPFANNITTVSKKDLRIVNKNLKKTNAYYIPNGINVKREQINKKNNYLFFAAGRIIPSKGLHILLSALKILNYKEDLIIAGDMEQDNAYKQKIIELSKNINVKFKGLIKEKSKLEELMANAKLFVYPSLIESMSMTMLEVASLKTPILCSDIPENKDVFSTEEVLYFETNNSSDLAKKIEWAINNESKMLAKSGKLFKKLKDNFQWKVIALQYFELYHQLIKK